MAGQLDEFPYPVSTNRYETKQWHSTITLQPYYKAEKECKIYGIKCVYS